MPARLPGCSPVHFAPGYAFRLSVIAVFTAAATAAHRRCWRRILLLLLMAEAAVALAGTCFADAFFAMPAVAATAPARATATPLLCRHHAARRARFARARRYHARVRARARLLCRATPRDAAA